MIYASMQYARFVPKLQVMFVSLRQSAVAFPLHQKLVGHVSLMAMSTLLPISWYQPKGLASLLLHLCRQYLKGQLQGAEPPP